MHLLFMRHMNDLRPTLIVDLLQAHGILMKGLVDESGKFRSGGVGIYRGDQLVHMVPPAKKVPGLMEDLLAWLAETDMHPLIAGSVFHYEFEFIHPFKDGNGRMGRLWQTLILRKWQADMGYLPVETVIREHQVAYYQALEEADNAANSIVFIEFMLNALNFAISELVLEQGSEISSEKIINLLEIKPEMAAREIAQEIGLSACAVEKNIAMLKAAGRLRRIGPAKGGHWEVMDD